MDIKYSVFPIAVASIGFLSACSTAKTVSAPSDIADDGEANVAVVSYEAEVYAAEKYPTVTRTRLDFLCTEDKLGGDCFSFSLPYKGFSDTGGTTTQHFFSSTGAKVLRFKYGQYNVDSVRHKVLVNRVPEVTCTYNKKKKREECFTAYRDEDARHRASLESLVPFTIGPGSGCYLGHLKIKLDNSSILSFEHMDDMEELQNRAADLPNDIRDTVMSYVDRPCQVNVVGAAE